MIKSPIKIVFLAISLILLFTNCEPEVVQKKKPAPSVSTTSVSDANKKNTYSAVKIGDLYWFQGNLNSTVYTVLRNEKGVYYVDTINNYKPYSTSIVSLTSSPIDTLAVQWPFNGKDSLVKKYGRMYTWYAVADARNICPSGWHVPNETEWDKMISVLGGDSLAGGKMKDTSNIEWNNPNLAEVNNYKLNVKSTGYRSEFGSYIDQGKFSFFWSSTSDPDDKEYGICYVLYAHSKKIIKRSISKRAAMAVRCVR